MCLEERLDCEEVVVMGERLMLSGWLEGECLLDEEWEE